jgi:hypothetical protein
MGTTQIECLLKQVRYSNAFVASRSRTWRRTLALYYDAGQPNYPLVYGDFAIFGRTVLFRNLLD